MQERAGQPLRAFALDFWNGSAALCESFRASSGISYPMLMLAGAAGIGSLYDTSYDAFFVVDGNGVIRYRRTLAGGRPTWRPDEIAQVVDQAIAELTVGVGNLPERDGFELMDAYPNPFNPNTRIPYELGGEAAEATVTLQILDLVGRTVRTLVSGRQATGQLHEALWDGRDDHGQSAPSGTYLANLKVGDRSQARLLTLVK